MALRFTPKYENENAMLYDLAKQNPFFEDTTFQELNKSNKGNDYTRALVSADEDKMQNLNFGEYKYLNSEDKMGYILNELYNTESEESYLKNKEYFNQQIKTAMAEANWKSLDVFQKTVNSVGGLLGNTLNAVFSVLEGTLDATLLITGGASSLVASIWGDGAEVSKAFKDVIAKDLTGTGAIQKGLDDFNKKYTYLTRGGVFNVLNDVITSIGQMAPLALNIPAPGVGTAVYYGAMAGRNAESVINSNPDINYGSLLLYTGASAALEYGTEKIIK